jgi:hypothetical protein
MLELLVTANVIPSTPILVTVMTEIRSSETSVISRPTRCHPRRQHSSYSICAEEDRVLGLCEP